MLKIIFITDIKKELVSKLHIIRGWNTTKNMSRNVGISVNLEAKLFFVI